MADFLAPYSEISAKYERLKHELEALNQTYQTLRINYTNLLAQYNLVLARCRNISEERDYWRSLADELQRNNTLLRRRLKERDLLLNKTYGDLRKIRDDLVRELQWFRENSRITVAKDEIREKCIHNRVLNVPCLIYVLENSHGLHYTEDSRERLKSPTEVLTEGGDCEDYAMLINAYLRSIDEYEYISLWQAGYGDYVIYEDDDQRVYYPNARQVILPRRGRVLILCYLTRRAGEYKIGHCISGITDNEPPAVPITFLFEPQTGEYLGTLDFNKLRLCRDGEIGCDDDLNSVYLLVDEDGVYVFNHDHWTSHKQVIEEIENVLTGFEQIR